MPGNRLTIGNVEITSLSDGILEFDPCNFYPDVSAEDWSAHEGALTAEHKAQFNLGSMLVRSDGRTLIFDTGMGPRPADAPDVAYGELINQLNEHGVRPEDIDMVVMTHMHRDHVGWNLQSANGKYEPTFPRARYWVSKGDWDYFRTSEALERFPYNGVSVLPLEELGLLEIVEGEHPLTSELTTLPTPGHTPGHMSVVVSSQGQRGLILGDAAHHPVQVHETEWSPRADIIPDLARDTRRALMERLEQEGTLVAAGHFPAPGFGKVVRLEGRRYWQAL